MGFKYLLSTLTVLVTLSSPAIAQSWSSWNSVVQDNLVQDTIWNALRNEVGSNNLGTETSVDLLTLAAIPSSLSKADLELTINPKVRQATFYSFLEAAAEEYPELANAMSQRDIFAIMGGYLPEYGLSTTNFADSMTNYLIELHGAANGKVTEPTPEITAAVREQVLNLLAQVSTSQDFVDRNAIQSASDDLLLRSVFIGTLSSAAIDEGDNQISEDVSLMTLETFGVDFSQLTLDSRGLTRSNE